MRYNTNRVMVDSNTLLLNGFGYPKETRTGEPIYVVIPPKNTQKHNILNNVTDSSSCPFEKMSIAKGAIKATPMATVSDNNTSILKYFFTNDTHFVIAI